MRLKGKKHMEQLIVQVRDKAKMLFELPMTAAF
jgi:hypothetical protein